MEDLLTGEKEAAAIKTGRNSLATETANPHINIRACGKFIRQLMATNVATRFLEKRKKLNYCLINGPTNRRIEK